jgi:hypothetical protein
MQKNGEHFGNAPGEGEGQAMTPINRNRGAGWIMPEAGRGAGAAPGASDGPESLPVAEALSTLEGNFATGKMPDAKPDLFPGKIAEGFYWSDAAVAGIQGPVGSGKTTTLLKSRLRRALAMPRSSIDGVRRYKLLVVRETYRQLWSTTIPSYLEVFPKDLGKWSGGRGDPVTHLIQFEDEFGPVEFTVEFMAFGDDIVSSMRGIQTTDMWLNETDTQPVDVLTAGIGRINRWPAREHLAGYPMQMRSYGQIVCDFNAPDEDNWTFRVFHNVEERARIVAELNRHLPEGAREVKFEFHNQPGYGEAGCENLQNLSPDYYPVQIGAMRAAGRGDMIDRLVFNKVTYLRVGEPVFQREFNRRIHVAEGTLRPWEGVPLRIGLDQGFKGAAVIAQYDTPHRWQVLGEMHFPQERLMAAEFGRRLGDLLERRFTGLRIEGAWADMAGEHGASQAADENDTWNLMVSRAANFRVRPQRIGTNRIQPRLEAVRAALEHLHGGTPGLLIDPSCKFLIRGLEARYVWTDQIDATGDRRKVPDKRLTEANVMDALQYLLLSEVRGNGASPLSTPDRPGLSGRNSGPPLPGGKSGLTTDYDILQPYGG